MAGSVPSKHPARGAEPSRRELTTEEFPEDTLVYLRRPGRESFELVIAIPNGARQIIVPISMEQVARLSVDAAAASVALIGQLQRKISDA